MAMIKCVKECGQEISDKAYNCPRCGFPMRDDSLPYRKMWWGYEWKSETEILGWPLIHVAIGFNKKTRRLYVAKGIIAIGQFALGLVTIAQFGIGFSFCFWTACNWIFCCRTIGYSLIFWDGSICGRTNCNWTIGLGKYVLAQAGYGRYLWTKSVKDPVAYEYFREFIMFFTHK